MKMGEGKEGGALGVWGCGLLGWRARYSKGKYPPSPSSATVVRNGAAEGGVPSVAPSAHIVRLATRVNQANRVCVAMALPLLALLRQLTNEHTPAHTPSLPYPLPLFPISIYSGSSWLSVPSHSLSPSRSPGHSPRPDPWRARSWRWATRRRWRRPPRSTSSTAWVRSTCILSTNTTPTSALLYATTYRIDYTQKYTHPL